jgi:YD repeat-containing protein
MTRDEHGVLTAFTYEWNGAPTAENSFDQTNVYDADGRLTSSATAFRSGTRQSNTEYQYEAGRLVSITNANVYDGQPSQSVVTLSWQGGRPVSRERGDTFATSASGLRGRDTRFYDGTGRLIRVDVDGGGLGTPVDGTMDMRRTWSYDGAGRIVHHEQDGTEAFDAPVIDGVPDSTATFDPACAAIAVLPRELYLLESWLRLP